VPVSIIGFRGFAPRTSRQPASMSTVGGFEGVCVGLLAISYINICDVYPGIVEAEQSLLKVRVGEDVSGSLGVAAKLHPCLFTTCTAVRFNY
jgi:hypothetical protein